MFENKRHTGIVPTQNSDARRVFHACDMSSVRWIQKMSLNIFLKKLEDTFVLHVTHSTIRGQKQAHAIFSTIKAQILGSEVALWREPYTESC